MSGGRLQVVPVLLLLIVVGPVAARLLARRRHDRLEVERVRAVAAEVARLLRHRRPVAAHAAVLGVPVGQHLLLLRFVHQRALGLRLGEQALLLRQAGAVVRRRGGRLRFDLSHHVTVGAGVLLLARLVAFRRAAVLLVAVGHRDAANDLVDIERR